MGVFKKLRSLFPIPRDWDKVDEKKNFVLRLEEAYRWLQMKCEGYDKRALTYITIPASSNKTIDLASGSRYLIITHSIAITVRQIFLVAVTTSGSVSATTFRTASNLSADTTVANKLKLTNNASNPVDVFIERLS